MMEQPQGGVAPTDTPTEIPGSPARVSVIIPCYNAARFVGRAVASALAQEGIAPPQVILVNDASTDDTAKVIRDLAAAHPTVEAHDNPENLGPAGTRNHALAKASGDWIAVLDADDAYGPGRLARLVARAEAEDLAVIADLPVMYDLGADAPAPEQLPTAPGEVSLLGFTDFLGHDAASGLDLGLLKPLYRRSLLDSGVLAYPEGVRHGEDCALYVALTRAGHRFGLLREAHYLFSTRVGALSGAFSPGSVTDVDYLSIARQARSMREDFAAEGILDPALETLLNTREEKALLANRRYGWTVLRKREFGRLGRWLRQSPENPKALARVIGAKLRGQRGLPE